MDDLKDKLGQAARGQPGWAGRLMLEAAARLRVMERDQALLVEHINELRSRDWQPIEQLVPQEGTEVDLWLVSRGDLLQQDSDTVNYALFSDGKWWRPDGAEHYTEIPTDKLLITHYRPLVGPKAWTLLKHVDGRRAWLTND